MLRSARIVMLLTVAVQIAAFVRTMIIAAQLGASLDVDAYNLGIVAPTFISTVIGGWLQVAFVGKYAGLVAVNDEEAAAAYRTRMLLLVGGLAFGTAAASILFPDRIMSFFLPDGEKGTAALAADALRVTGLTLVPIIIGDFIGLVLNSHGRFFAAAFAPLLNALVSITVLWSWPDPGIAALVWSLLAGTVAQLAVVIVSLASMRLRFTLMSKAARGEIVATILIALPLLPAIMLSNSASAILQFRSAELGEGAVAILGYAMRLHNAIGQIIVISFATVLLPHFAALWARGQKEQIVLLLRRLTRSGILTCAYIGGGIYLMGTPTVSVLLERGAFDAQTAEKVAQLWAVLILSLFPFALGTFIAKLCQAMRNSVVILLSGAVSFAVVWTVSLIGADAGSMVIVAFASTAAFAATAIFWLLWLARTIRARPILSDMFAAALRTLVVLGPPFLFDLLYLGPITEPLPPILAVGIRGVVYTVVGLALIRVFRFQPWFLGQRLAVSRS